MILGAPAPWAAQAHRAFARLVLDTRHTFARLGRPRNTQVAAKKKQLHRTLYSSRPAQSIVSPVLRCLNGVSCGLMANNGLRAAAGRVGKRASKQGAGGMSGALRTIYY